MKRMKISKIVLLIWYLALFILSLLVPPCAILILLTAGIEWLWNKPVIRITKK